MLLTQQFECKILTSMKEILSLSHQKDVRPCASSPVTTSIEIFHPEDNESKTAGAANILADGPEPDIPVKIIF